MVGLSEMHFLTRKWLRVEVDVNVVCGKAFKVYIRGSQSGVRTPTGLYM